MLIEHFDELSVLKSLKDLYRLLDRDNRKELKDLFIMRYYEMERYIGREDTDEDAVIDLAEAYLAGLLREPDPITRYAYDAEVSRKRDRSTEAVIAAPGVSAKKMEMDKALRFWSQMTQQYVDTVSDGAAQTAMREAGVKRGMWHTQEDEKVCADCYRLNKKIFLITKIPVKPHWRCRCWVSPLI